jgi:hypothetical protein
MVILSVCWHATVQFTRIVRVKTYSKSSMKILKVLYLISLNLATVSLLKNFKSNLSFKEYRLRD